MVHIAKIHGCDKEVEKLSVEEFSDLVLGKDDRFCVMLAQVRADYGLSDWYSVFKKLRVLSGIDVSGEVFRESCSRHPGLIERLDSEYHRIVSSRVWKLSDEVRYLAYMKVLALISEGDKDILKALIRSGGIGVVEKKKDDDGADDELDFLLKKIAGSLK